MIHLHPFLSVIALHVRRLGGFCVLRGDGGPRRGEGAQAVGPEAKPGVSGWVRELPSTQEPTKCVCAYVRMCVCVCVRVCVRVYVVGRNIR